MSLGRQARAVLRALGTGVALALSTPALAQVASAAVQVAPAAAQVALAEMPVVVEFSLADPGNRDRELQFAPGAPGLQKRLARFVAEDAAPRLSEGEKLEVRLRQVTLAGSLEPWRAAKFDTVRFLTPAYPPRIVLSFRWTDAHGAVIREGERDLTNLDYQRDPRAALSRDTLRYERALLDEWLEKELRVR